MLEGYAFEASAAYDKAVMTLSGGALGISFAFVKDIVKEPLPDTIYWLWLAWLSFGLSLTAVLISMLFSQKAIRVAIDQVDKGTIYSSTPGGISSWITSVLTWISGLGFISGVVILAYFVKINLGRG